MDFDDYIKELKECENETKPDESRISISIDELNHLYEEVYQLDLIYSSLLYDTSIYKKMANISFNVVLPLRKTNTDNIERLLPVDSVIHINWHDYQRIITSSHDRYTSMVNLFNTLQHKSGSQPIRIKNPLNPKKDMPSLKSIDLVLEEDDDSSANHKELMELYDYMERSKKK